MQLNSHRHLSYSWIIRLALGLILIAQPILQITPRASAKSESHSSSAAVGHYDARKAPAIAPVIGYDKLIGPDLYSTFPRDVAVDAQGNAHVTGITTAFNFPTTSGAPKATFPNPNGYVTFIVKLSPSGSVLYSATLGASTTSGSDEGQAVAVDPAGSIYILGYTYSGQYPTTLGALRNGGHTFVTKLTPGVSGLVYSAIVGSGQFEARDIVVDAQGIAYLVGGAGAGLPATEGGYQPTLTKEPNETRDWPDVAVVKLNATGSAVLRATYLGGGAAEEAGSIALDNAGNVYIYGGTSDRSRSGIAPPATIPFPRTPGAYRTTDDLNCNGFCPDSGGVFIAKFSNDLSRLFYSTIIGGAGPGGGFAHLGTSMIAVDSAGNAYVTGATNSPYFPTTPGALQRVGGAETALIGTGDAFVTKLSADGSRLIYSTYLGGNGERTGGGGIAIDAQGFAYITGITTSHTFPVTTQVSGRADGKVKAFITKLNQDGSGVVYSTFFKAAKGYSVAVDPAGNAYVTGDAGGEFQVGDEDPPGTAGPDPRGQFYGFAVRINNTTAAEPTLPTPPAPSNPNSTNTFRIGGRVRDANGRSVPGIPIVITGTNIEAKWLAERFIQEAWQIASDGTIKTTLYTDNRGSYASEGAPPGGNFTVTAMMPDVSFDPTSKTITSLGGNQIVSFVTGKTIPPVVSLSSASYEPFTFAEDMILSAFGSGLATATQVATDNPLPTTLAGTTVTIRDSRGEQHPARLFFVSPTQVNYLVPAGVAYGLGAVIVKTGDGQLSTGSLNITRVAPGLFSADANGRGLAAAVVLRIKSDGQQIYEPVTRFDPARGMVVPVPIDLGPQSDRVFLVLFGTGWRNRLESLGISAEMGGENALFQFVGPQSGFAGLDQANLRIPLSLAGRGEVSVTLTVEQQTSNTVKVSIK